VVLVISEALIHLGAGDVRKAPNDNTVHGFTILEETDDVVDTHARALDDRAPAAHARLAGDVAVTNGLKVSVHGFK